MDTTPNPSNQSEVATVPGMDTRIATMVDAIASSAPIVPIMQLQGVSVAFSGKVAVRDVTFDVMQRREQAHQGGRTRRQVY